MSTWYLTKVHVLVLVCYFWSCDHAFQTNDAEEEGEFDEEEGEYDG